MKRQTDCPAVITFLVGLFCILGAVGAMDHGSTDMVKTVLVLIAGVISLIVSCVLVNFGGWD